MSQTGANADEWIPCRPGTEGALALGIAHVILSEKLAPQGAGSRAGSLIAGWSAGLPDFTPEAVEKQTGVSAAVITRLAHEITQSGSAPPSSAARRWRTPTALFNALAVNALESLVDTGRDRGAILGFTGFAGFTPEPPLGDAAQSAAPMQASLAQPQCVGAIRADRPAARAADAAALRRQSDFLGAARGANPRSHRQNSLHRQLRQLHRRNQRPGRPDLAGPRAARVLARQRSRVGLVASGGQPRAARRCSAARYAPHARRAAWPRASAWWRRCQGPSLDDFRRHAACRVRSAPRAAAAPSTQRRTTISGQLRRQQGGWWSVPSTANTAGPQQCLSCGGGQARSYGAGRAGICRCRR